MQFFFNVIFFQCGVAIASSGDTNISLLYRQTYFVSDHSDQFLNSFFIPKKNVQTKVVAPAGFDIAQTLHVVSAGLISRSNTQNLLQLRN